MSEGSHPSDRLRSLIAWVGIVFFVVIAALAALLLAWDVWRVGSHIGSLAALRATLVAGAVIAGGVLLTGAVAWLAGSGSRGLRTGMLISLTVLVIVRIAVALSYDGVLSGEPGIYDRQAQALAAGGCCPWDQAIERPPGYTFLLAGAYALMGPGTAAAETLNVLFAVATGLIVMALARHAYGAPAGVVALLLYGLWPAGALMVVVRIPHSAYDLAFAASAGVTVAASPGWRGSTLAGAALGLSQYLRPTTYLMLPVFIVARIWGGGRWRDLLAGSVVPMVLGFLLVLVPIAAWNLSTRGSLEIATSSFGGSSLYHGTNVASGGRWSRAARDEIHLLSDDPWERSQAAGALALGRVRDDPLGIAALALRKQVTLWGRETYGVRYGIRRDLASSPWRPTSVLPSLASGAFYAGLLAFATLGLYLRRRDTDALGVLVVLTMLALSLLHAFVEVRDRYHAFVIPLLMPLAALAVIDVVKKVQLRLVRHRPPSPEGPAA